MYYASTCNNVVHVYLLISLVSRVTASNYEDIIAYSMYSHKGATSANHKY